MNARAQVAAALFFFAGSLPVFLEAADPPDKVELSGKIKWVYDYERGKRDRGRNRQAAVYRFSM